LFVDIIIIFLREIAQYLFIQVGNYGGGSVYQNSTDVAKNMSNFTHFFIMKHVRLVFDCFFFKFLFLTFVYYFFDVHKCSKQF